MAKLGVVHTASHIDATILRPKVATEEALLQSRVFNRSLIHCDTLSGGRISGMY